MLAPFNCHQEYVVAGTQYAALTTAMTPVYGSSQIRLTPLLWRLDGAGDVPDG